MIGRDTSPAVGKDTQFKPGEVANPNGRPKGALSLSTHIQNLLNDEEFTLDNFLFNGKQYKGAPIKAIITVAVMQALQGDNKWAEWLAKHGYGTNIDIKTGGERLTQSLTDEELDARIQDYIARHSVK